MVVDQLGPRGRTSKLTHSFMDDATQHNSQMVFHGPVAYVEDPYSYVAESETPLEHLLRPLFVKRSDYKHQREYRFVVWDEHDSETGATLLDVSPALLQTTLNLPSGPAPVPARASTPRTPPPAATHPAERTSAPPAPDPFVDPVFAMSNDPHVNHGVRTIRAEDVPADLHEKTTIYPATETLRRIVGKAANEPRAAAAAWHAEPYIRCLCSRFQDPIGSIRLTPDYFIVITVNFPESSDSYARTAIGPNGMVRHKIGRGREYTDSTSGRPPHEGWPHLDSFERQLEEYGLLRRPDPVD